MSTPDKVSKRADDEEESKSPRPTKTSKLDHEEEKKETKHPSNSEEKKQMYSFDPYTWLRRDVSPLQAADLKRMTKRLLSVADYRWKTRVSNLFLLPSPHDEETEERKIVDVWHKENLSDMTIGTKADLLTVLLHPEEHDDQENLDINKIFKTVPMTTLMRILYSWVHILRRKIYDEMFKERSPPLKERNLAQQIRYVERSQEVIRDHREFREIARRLDQFKSYLRENVTAASEGEDSGEKVNITCTYL